MANIGSVQDVCSDDLWSHFPPATLTPEETTLWVRRALLDACRHSVITSVLLGRVHLVPRGFTLFFWCALSYFVFFLGSAKRCQHLGNKAIWVGDRLGQEAEWPQALSQWPRCNMRHNISARRSSRSHTASCPQPLRSPPTPTRAKSHLFSPQVTDGKVTKKKWRRLTKKRINWNRVP